jgi:hypothetical protein
MKTLRTLALVAALTIAAFAQEKTKAASYGNTSELLSSHLGKQVELRLKSGDKISGKVAEVGATFVHVTALTGQEFFDAAVVIQDISAVVFRAAK